MSIQFRTLCHLGIISVEMAGNPEAEQDYARGEQGHGAGPRTGPQLPSIDGSIRELKRLRNRCPWRETRARVWGSGSHMELSQAERDELRGSTEPSHHNVTTESQMSGWGPPTSPATETRHIHFPGNAEPGIQTITSSQALSGSVPPWPSSWQSLAT